MPCLVLSSHTASEEIHKQFLIKVFVGSNFPACPHMLMIHLCVWLQRYNDLSHILTLTSLQSRREEKCYQKKKKGIFINGAYTSENDTTRRQVKKFPCAVKDDLKKEEKFDLKLEALAESMMIIRMSTSIDHLSRIRHTALHSMHGNLNSASQLPSRRGSG